MKVFETEYKNNVNFMQQTNKYELNKSHLHFWSLIFSCLSPTQKAEVGQLKANNNKVKSHVCKSFCFIKILHLLLIEWLENFFKRLSLLDREFKGQDHSKYQKLPAHLPGNYNSGRDNK